MRYDWGDAWTCVAHFQVANRNRANIYRKWFAFLNKRWQRGARWLRGNEVGTPRRNMQIWSASQPASQPASYYEKNRSTNVEKNFRPCPLPVVTTSRRFCWSAQLGFSFTNHCFDNSTPAWRIIWITARLFTDKCPLSLSHWRLVKTASLVRTSILLIIHSQPVT